MTYNYDKIMQKIINEQEGRSEKPTLLLHCCCAPCFSGCFDKLIDAFKVTAYFYNPNMDSEAEYVMRAKELERLCNELGISCIIEKYNPSEFYGEVVGLENLPEGDKRCENCFNIRLAKTAKEAKKKGYDFFATTLTVSPLKSASKINAVGENISQKFGVEYLPSDFKKRSGYQNSIIMSKKYGLYRQNYCGCLFSKPKS